MTGPPVLAPRDARALARLVRRVAGKGFKLATIEVAGPAQREQVLGWVERVVTDAGATLVRCDLGALPGLNLWSELTETLALPEGPVVVAAWGLDGEPGRRRGDGGSGLLQQLNVQRDLLRRDLPVTWLVFLHPGTALRLWMEAPDFADFVGLRVRAQEAEGRAVSVRAADPDSAGPRPGTRPGDEGSPLAPLWERLEQGSLAGARDWLAENSLRGAVSEGLLAEGRAWLALEEGRFGEGLAELSRAKAGEVDGLVGGAAGLESGGKTVAVRRARLRGMLLRRLGRFDEAAEALGSILPKGPTDEAGSAAVLHELALVQEAQGDVSGAKETLERALELQVRESGTKDHPDVAVTLSALAGLLLAQGDLSGAKETLERSLEILARVWGTEEHPSVAVSLHELARVLRAQGDLLGARETLERSLAILTRVYGREDHPNVAASLHELAQVLLAQGDLSGAKETLERSLAIQSRVFGTEEHPSVGASLHSLAGVLRAQGDLSGAQEMLERSVAIQARGYGTEEHPNVATSLHELAGVLKDQGDLASAEQVYRRVVEIERRIFGATATHSTAQTELSLAVVLAQRGKSDEALPFARHAASVFVRVLPPGHMRTRAAMWLVQQLSADPADPSSI